MLFDAAVSDAAPCASCRPGRCAFQLGNCPQLICDVRDAFDHLDHPDQDRAHSRRRACRALAGLGPQGSSGHLDARLGELPTDSLFYFKSHHFLS